MTTVVLIPGAFHGPWCFERLVPLLRDAGVEAIAADLPGTGPDAGTSPPPDQSAWTPIRGGGRVGHCRTRGAARP